jgi:DNA-binding response OmpR family regulator
VDDDTAILRMFSKMFSSEGYDVDTAERGSDALRLATGRAYDLAVLDVRLPDIDGIDLLLCIERVSPVTKKVILTGDPTDEGMAKAFERGAAAYIVKPVSPETMVDTVRRLLAGV